MTNKSHLGTLSTFTKVLNLSHQEASFKYIYDYNRSDAFLIIQVENGRNSKFLYLSSESLNFASALRVSFCDCMDFRNGGIFAENSKNCQDHT